MAIADGSDSVIIHPVFARCASSTHRYQPRQPDSAAAQTRKPAIERRSDPIRRRRMARTASAQSGRSRRRIIALYNLTVGLAQSVPAAAAIASGTEGTVAAGSVVESWSAAVWRGAPTDCPIVYCAAGARPRAALPPSPRSLLSAASLRCRPQININRPINLSAPARAAFIELSRSARRRCRRLNYSVVSGANSATPPSCSSAVYTVRWREIACVTTRLYPSLPITGVPTRRRVNHYLPVRGVARL